MIHAFFPNKNIVQVSEPFDGTIEESILRRTFEGDCSDKMLERALKENLPFLRF